MIPTGVCNAVERRRIPAQWGLALDGRRVGAGFDEWGSGTLWFWLVNTPLGINDSH